MEKNAVTDKLVTIYFCKVVDLKYLNNRGV